MGLLFAQKAAWGEPHYFCPRDLFSAWLFALIDPPHFSPIKEVHSVPETPSGIGHDLFHFLICVDREQVPLTSAGQIYKRMLKKDRSRIGDRLQMAGRYHLGKEGDSQLSGTSDGFSCRISIDAGREWRVGD